MPVPSETCLLLSQELEAELARGQNEPLRPGYVRLSLPFCTTLEEADYVVVCAVYGIGPGRMRWQGGWQGHDPRDRWRLWLCLMWDGMSC